LNQLGAIAIGVVFLVLAVSATRAQVIDVGSDGATQTFSGPVRTVDGVTAPIAAAAAAASFSRAQVADLLARSAERHQLSPRLVEAVAWRESRFNQAAVSAKGARGVMQLMPATAAAMGVDADDLAGNIEGGAAYLASLMRRFDGDIVRSLAAYNAGPDAVRRYGGAPPYAETQAYVAAVLDRLAGGANGLNR
jgi:soluble lytic murein transglycosylase-like protein